MTTCIDIQLGLVGGSIVGIAFGYEDAARFGAIGCGILGAILGPLLLRQIDTGGR